MCEIVNDEPSRGTQELVALLRCPVCNQAFQWDGATFDVLRCQCSQYPMVFGIPVLMHGAVGYGGRTAEQLVDSIKAGNYREALEALLLPAPPKPSDLARRVTERLSSMRGLWRLSRYIHEKRLQDWKARARQFFDGALNGTLTAEEYLKFHFCDSGLNQESAADYFIYKFLQPRNMVALSLAETLQNTQGFILDLCCGAGHICFGLEQRFPERTVVGIDRSFPMLFVARNWNPEGPPLSAAILPSSSRSVPRLLEACFAMTPSTTSGTSRPSRRVPARIAGGRGSGAPTRTYDILEDDQNSCSLAPMEYADLMADVPCVMLREFPLMARYLQRMGPDLSATEPGMEEAPVLSIIASRNPGVFKAYGEVGGWPHGRGPLVTNPLYGRSKDDAGRNVLELRYTSPPDLTMSLRRNIGNTGSIWRNGFGAKTWRGFRSTIWWAGLF